MAKEHFGTDGVRGTVGQGAITPDFILKLGWACGMAIQEEYASQIKKGYRPSVIIGKDTRISGYMLESALEAGFASAGVDVWLTGPMPTPAIAYLTRTFHCSAGIMVTASHNPFTDNGVKFFSSRGTKISDAMEDRIVKWLAEPLTVVPPQNMGKAARVKDAPGRYIEFCKSVFPPNLDLNGIKIAVDCANGAMYHIAPDAFKELGAEVIVTGVSPNGMNINEESGSTHPETISELTLLGVADIGIAFDGDGDRVIMSDSEGRIFDGDDLTAIIAEWKLKNGTLGENPGVVGTIMTNTALEHRFKNLGIPFYRTQVGDKYVLEEMEAKGCVLGGESSGHIISLDKHTTGDGLLAALQVLAAIVESGSSLSAILEGYEAYPQILQNVKFEGISASEVMESPAVKEIISLESEAIKGFGRVLVRPSGTEPKIRVMVEHEDDKKAKKIADRICREISNFLVNRN